MDTNTMLVIVVVVLAVVAVIAFLMFRQRSRVQIKGPLGTGLEMEGSNEQAAVAPAIDVKDITAKKGSVTATDETGRGIKAETVVADQDVNLRTTPGKDSQDPKAPPPA